MGDGGAPAEARGQECGPVALERPRRPRGRDNDRKCRPVLAPRAACRYNPVVENVRGRRLAAEKRKMIAAARKLPTILDALLWDRKSWPNA